MRRQNRYNRSHKSNVKKERIIMIASSVFVLAALTMTGVYVKNSTDKTKNDGYHIDFSVLEKETQNQTQNKTQNETQKITGNETTKNSEAIMPGLTDDDLDYMPMEQVDSGIVEIPGVTNKTENAEAVNEDGERAATDQNAEAQNAEAQSVAEQNAAEQTAGHAEPGYKAGATLVWPASGNVLIPYSMDKTVYFSTLAQYKYNPAMIVSASEGDMISAAAAGEVTEVFYDEEIGNAVTVDIGGGYEVTYGQLKNVEVSEGNFLEKGSVIGYVAAPTMYYSMEGTNAYFALTKDGVPADPMAALQ